VRCLNLGSYNYLGFAASDPYCTPAVSEAIGRWGVSTCSPRAEGGTTPLHAQLEAAVASFLGVEDAIAYGMGFATNSASLPLLCGAQGRAGRGGEGSGGRLVRRRACVAAGGAAPIPVKGMRRCRGRGAYPGEGHAPLPGARRAALPTSRGEGATPPRDQAKPLLVAAPRAAHTPRAAPPRPAPPPGPGTLVLSDALNHTSIVAGVKAGGAAVHVFRHNDARHLEALLRFHIAGGQPRSRRPWRKARPRGAVAGVAPEGARVR
jgi:hypothetical protein